MGEPHVSDLQWSRLWHLTLAASDRRRITEAVQAGQVLDDPHEARLAAELARQLLTEKRRRPPLWLVRGWSVLALLLIVLLLWSEDVPTWRDFLVPAVFALNGLIWSMARRSAPNTELLEQAEQRNLARSAGEGG